MLLLVDKPVGITSFDVIRELRKKMGIQKMGHSGTLDPAASGLLIVATDGDTKKLTELIGLPKTYEVTVKFGMQTDTGDLDGEVVQTAEVDLSSDDIKKQSLSLKGVHRISVPVYSAIKRDGEPLYKKARRGEKVVPPIKRMEVTRVDVVDIDDDQVSLVMDVSSGSYIRSLSEELGRRLGVPAVTSALRRTTIGPYSIADAKKLEML